MKKLFRAILISLGVLSIAPAALSVVSNATSSVNQLNTFAFQIYREMKLPNENQMFSPYSVSSLLSRLIMGAEGDTRNQMMHLFNLKSLQDLEAMDKILSRTDAALVDSQPCFGWFSCQFKKWMNKEDFMIANAFWADKNLMYKSAFLEDLEQDKSIHFYVIDFAQNPEAARGTINRWGENQTQNIIKNLMGPDSVSSQTKLILTNAIYFKEKWKLPFKPVNTEQKPFTLINSQQVQVPMMMQKEQMDYAENTLFQALKMTYNKNSLAMLILLPKEKVRLQEVLQKMTSEMFNQLLQSLKEKKILVHLPKFTMESQFDTVNLTLTKMGLKDAFSEQANFSHLTDSKLILSKILQKAFIQVNEEGTVAAAATGVAMAGGPPAKSIEFNANRPFLFLIYDTETKIILFMGQLMNPNKNQE